MKPRAITFDSVFEKHWHKYLKGLTEKQKEHLRERLTIFKEDAFDKRLKTHRLKGNLKEYYAFSISYSDTVLSGKKIAISRKTSKSPLAPLFQRGE